jgi:hypothetical protein
VTTDERVRNALRERAAQEPPPLDDELVALLEHDLEQHDRNALIKRMMVAGGALIIAIVAAWQMLPGTPSTQRHVHVESTTTTVVPQRNTHAHPTSIIATPAPSPAALLDAGALETHLVTTPTVPNQPPSSPSNAELPGASQVTPGTAPVTPVTAPAPLASNPNFWAIAAEVHDGQDQPLVVVFGKAPTNSTVHVASSLGSHDYSINDQGDFRWSYKLSHSLPTPPVDFDVTCDGCGELHLQISHFDASPAQPGPNVGFSPFFVSHQTDWNPGGFLFGGFDTLARSNSVTVSSKYGSFTFAVRDGVGARVQFPGAPMDATFPVSVSSGTATPVTYSVTRTR